MKNLLVVGALLAGLCATLPPAQAQTFGPVITVNGQGISGFELDQRARLLVALGTARDPAREAREGLIEDKLKIQAAEAAGFSLSADELEQAITNFAARSNLTTEQFVEVLAQEGIEPQTLRDFLRTNLLWGDFIRQRFAPRIRVSEEEVERALALSGERSTARIRLAEIVIPAPPDRRPQAESLAQQLKDNITTNAQFSSAAERFSVAPTRTNGGLRDWIEVSALPPALRGVLLTLGPGEVSEPIALSAQAIALLQVRGLQEQPARAPEAVAIEVAVLTLPTDANALSDARTIIAEDVRTCDDLHTLTRNVPSTALLREVYPVEEAPQDIVLATADLDNNETTFIQRAGRQAFVMLCGRTAELADEDPGRVQLQLSQQRLTSYAQNYLEELRSDATIR